MRVRRLEMTAEGPRWLVENSSGYPDTMIAVGSSPADVIEEGPNGAEVRMPGENDNRGRKGKRKTKDGGKDSDTTQKKKRKTAGASFAVDLGNRARRNQQLPAARPDAEHALAMISNSLNNSTEIPFPPNIPAPGAENILPAIPFVPDSAIDPSLLNGDKESSSTPAQDNRGDLVPPWTVGGPNDGHDMRYPIYHSLPSPPATQQAMSPNLTTMFGSDVYAPPLAGAGQSPTAVDPAAAHLPGAVDPASAAHSPAAPSAAASLATSDGAGNSDSDSSDSDSDEDDEQGLAPIDTALLKVDAWSSWYKKAREYLEFDGDLGDTLKDDVWMRCLLAWMVLEARNGYEQLGMNLGAKGRPPCVRVWIQTRRVPQYTFDNNEDLDKYVEQVCTWWSGLQPKWRAVAGITRPLTARERGMGSWDEMRAAGINGYYSFIAALAWWGRSIDGIALKKRREKARDDWVLAVEDLIWVLTATANSPPAKN